MRHHIKASGGLKFGTFWRCCLLDYSWFWESTERSFDPALLGVSLGDGNLWLIWIWLSFTFVAQSSPLIGHLLKGGHPASFIMLELYTSCTPPWSGVLWGNSVSSQFTVDVDHLQTEKHMVGYLKKYVISNEHWVVGKNLTCWCNTRCFVMNLYYML